MKEVKWSSPKYYQKGWDKFSQSVKAKLPYRGYCKKLKAKHNFVWQSTNAWIISDSKWTWENYKCSGCGKQKMITPKSELRRKDL